MATTTLSIKTDVQLKKEAMRIADEIGVPLPSLVTAFLKQFIRDGKVTFSAAGRMTPSLERILDHVERDIGEDRNLSPTFENATDAIQWLHSHAD